MFPWFCYQDTKWLKFHNMTLSAAAVDCSVWRQAPLYEPVSEVELNICRNHWQHEQSI